MTAGPTPLPPARLAGDGGADPLPPRAGVRRDLRAGARAAAKWSSRPRTRCSASPPPGRGRMESAVANLVAPASPRSSPRAASSASAGPSCATPTAPTPAHLEFEWGEKVDPARVDAGAGRARSARRGPSSRHPVRDLDRRRQRRPGARRGRARRTARSSAWTPSRASARSTCPRTSGAWTWSSPGSQKSLMSPPGPRLRLGLRSRDGARGAQSRGAAATTSTGSARAKGQLQGPARHSRSPRP